MVVLHSEKQGVFSTWMCSPYSESCLAEVPFSRVTGLTSKLLPVLSLSLSSSDGSLSLMTLRGVAGSQPNNKCDASI